jgi:hypothetical protein
MNTCAPDSAAWHRAAALGSPVAVIADGHGTGMSSVPVVPAKTLDAPVSSVSRLSGQDVRGALWHLVST